MGGGCPILFSVSVREGESGESLALKSVWDFGAWTQPGQEISGVLQTLHIILLTLFRLGFQKARVLHRGLGS